MKRIILVLMGINFSISEIQAQGTWYLPGPRGRSVIPFTGCFIDGQTGFAVKNPNRFDTSESIQKTIDGGASWFPLTSGPNIPIRSIHFPRYKIGFAMGANGTTLLKTMDAGLSWERWEVDQRLDQIQFKSDSIGYAMPDLGGFLKTIDGGKKWHPVPLGGVQPAYFTFGTEREGIIIPLNKNASPDSSLLKTSNGGATWKWIAHAPKIEELGFLNSENGYATGSQTLPGTSENSLPQTVMGVFKTTDGGMTWKVVLSNPVKDGAPHWKYSRPIMQNISVGYVIANKWNATKPIPGSMILKTINGGETWTTEYENEEMHLFSLQFPEVNTGYAKGTVEIGNPDLDRAILIKYRYIPVSIATHSKIQTAIRPLKTGMLNFGELGDKDALGRSTILLSPSIPKINP